MDDRGCLYLCYEFMNRVDHNELIDMGLKGFLASLCKLVKGLGT